MILQICYHSSFAIISHLFLSENHTSLPITLFHIIAFHLSPHKLWHIFLCNYSFAIPATVSTAIFRLQCPTFLESFFQSSVLLIISSKHLLATFLVSLSSKNELFMLRVLDNSGFHLFFCQPELLFSYNIKYLVQNLPYN